jgi:hypothetical protein
LGVLGGSDFKNHLWVLGGIAYVAVPVSVDFYVLFAEGALYVSYQVGGRVFFDCVYLCWRFGFLLV